MIAVDMAISRFRRDLALSASLRFGLLAAAGICMIGAPVVGLVNQGMFVLAALGAAWIYLTYLSVRGTRLAAGSPGLIATGQFDQAERQIEIALRSFSLFRTAKLMSMHHLAVLRHAQRRWREAALLCQAILSQRLLGMEDLQRGTLLLQADALLQLDDLRGAYLAMNGLYRCRLRLPEALNLQMLQLDYGSRVGEWESMLNGVATKVQMSELMPAGSAARSQAFLALAAYKTGRLQLAKWLRSRAELLADNQDIAADRPLLAEMLKNPGA